MQGNKSWSVGVADCDTWQSFENMGAERLFQLARFNQRFPFGNLVQLCKDADTVGIRNELIHGACCALIQNCPFAGEIP